jgi:hypothetical protein
MSQAFERFKVEWVAVSELKVHPKIQRTFKQAWGDWLKANFDPDGCGELYGVRNGRGAIYIFNGQHRLYAVKELWGGDEKVPVRIFDDIPLERQASLFRMANTHLGMGSLDLWFQRVIEKDAAVVQITALLKAFNLRVDKTRGDGVVQAVKALEHVYKQAEGSILLDRTLRLLTDAWGTNPDAFDGQMLRGASMFMQKFEKQIDVGEFTRKLERSEGPSRLLGQAKDLSRATRMLMARAVATRLIEVYNEKRRKGRLEL